MANISFMGCCLAALLPDVCSVPTPTLKSLTWPVLQNKCATYVTCFCRPYGVHPVSAGQFPVWGGAGGAQRWAALHRIRLPEPHHPMAKRWSAVTFRLPLDAAYYWPHHFRLEAWGQRQLHLRGHQQLWIQRGDRSPQRHRWVKSCWAVKHHYSGSATTKQCWSLHLLSPLHTTPTATDGAKEWDRQR